MTVFSEAMREALRLTRAGALRDATRVIRDSLRGPQAPTTTHEGTFVPASRDAHAARSASGASRPLALDPPPVSRSTTPEPGAAEAVAPRPVSPGRFVSGAYSNAAGTRAYQLWVPGMDTGVAASARPLIVMLHGCTQDADDFARGTRMNEYADRHGCYVLYPIQDGVANPQRCWRWFETANQARGRGEPSILAGMTTQLAGEYGVDPARIYVAGLSAGAAMAMVLGETYPDVFAALAIHSGLPLGAARDVPSAFAAMAGRSKPHARTNAAQHSTRPVPGIVIHGDADRMVAPGNGDAVVRQLRERYEHSAGSALVLRSTTEPTHARSGFHTADGRLVIEQWSVRNGGHAWAGGASAGSYTDPAGPDASARIVEFFLTHSLTPARGGH
ncbi:PHB depolymerase family esterase [Tahibacter sp.]|uniref:extracellular catalytic domain type 1 short-chain-length polyhydroxyalkanoate depolymerase n=1 Tax=Tahibacter sp. TaxID=2056211 RepID=UPI0028C4A9C8|nr:PHB depolymerase family esterase [Tahibacter sp.]